MEIVRLDPQVRAEVYPIPNPDTNTFQLFLQRSELCKVDPRDVH
jgi:hypothetical protein